MSNLEEASRRLGAAFDRALARVTVTSRYVRVAGQVVELRFAGSALADTLFQAFAHLEVPPSTAGLSINVFDSESTGEPLPLTLREREGINSAGQPSFQAHDGWYGSYHRMDSGISLLDSVRNQGFYWAESQQAVPGWERGGPFKSILSCWLPLRGTRFVHAGAVGAANKGVLLAGPSGSGKSTTALTCLAAGMDYAGDDYSALSVADRRAYSLYRSTKLHTAHLPDVPGLGKSIHTGLLGDDKAVFFPSPGKGGALATYFDVAALVLPKVTHASRPSIRPATGAEALATIAPSTLLQLSAATPSALSDLAALCRNTPAFHLELGGRMDLVPGLLKELL